MILEISNVYEFVSFIKLKNAFGSGKSDEVIIYFLPEGIQGVFKK